MTTGYTAGVFDLFHVGHVNLLRAARDLCDRLIVGVSTDDVVAKTKGARCAVPFHERIEIVRSCRFVDAAIAQNDLDKVEAWHRLHYDVLFVGDDWFGHQRWQGYEASLREVGVRVVYLPYTEGVSSTQLRRQLRLAGN
jgi:glycerol-3-phosphate cytidylyltransferase